MKRRILSFFIGGALLFSSASIVFAAEADLIREYEFEAKNVDNLSYEAQEEIKEDGKTYRLIDIEYEIIKNNEIEVKKSVKTSDKEKYEKNIDYKLSNGKTVKLKALEKDISWQESSGDEIVKTQEYKNRNDIPQSIKDKKFGFEGEDMEITLKLKSVDNISKTENFSAPATFYTPVKGGSVYRFNGKIVTIGGNSPMWSNYKEDVKDYLGLNGNTYVITGGSWSDDYMVSGDQYVRHATYTGTKVIPLYKATFTETADTTKIYTADITYTGKDGNAKVKAIVSYEKIMGIREYIIIGAGIIVLALLVAAIIYVISKRRQEGRE